MGLNAVWESISVVPLYDFPKVSNSCRYADLLSEYILGYTYFLCPRFLVFWTEEKPYIFLTHKSGLSEAHWATPVNSDSDGPSLFIRTATMEKFQGRGILFLNQTKPNHKTKQKQRKGSNLGFQLAFLLWGLLVAVYWPSTVVWHKVRQDASWLVTD